MKEIFWELIKSKKAKVWIASLVVTIIGYVVSFLGLDLPPDQAMELGNSIAAGVITLAGTYMVGQGAADFGKEAKKEEKKALGFDIEKLKTITKLALDMKSETPPPPPPSTTDENPPSAS